MTSNTQRTLKYLKEKDYKCDIVERWIPNPKHPGGGFRKDFMGLLDIIAIGENEIIGVQSCGSNFAEHDRNILANPVSKLWLKTGATLILIGWRKVKKKRGGKQMIWRPRVKVYTLEDFGLENNQLNERRLKNELSY